MNSVKAKRIIAAYWLALALILGGSVVTAPFGLDTVPTAHACVGSGSGGGCSS